MQSVGVNALQSLIATTNTTSNGQYVFGGINSSVAPMADYFSSTTSAAKTAIDTAFQTTFGCLPTDAAASTITAAQMQSFLSGSFAAQFRGVQLGEQLVVGFEHQSDRPDRARRNHRRRDERQPAWVPATRAGLRDARRVRRLATELRRAAGGGLHRDLADHARGELHNGDRSQVGASLSQVTDANNSMSSQMTILQTQIGNLDNVNSAAVAAQINTLSTQLQTAYELTAQLQKLSLAQYLPVA